MTSLRFLIEPPPALAIAARQWGGLGDSLGGLGRWSEAFEPYRRAWELLLTAQPAGSRFHKGQPLHNMGYARIQVGLRREGLRWTLLAFVEDALSRAEESPSVRDELQRPAAQTLRLFGFAEADLHRLSVRIRDRVTSGALIQDPTEVFVAEDLDRFVRQVPVDGSRDRPQPGPVRVFVSSPGDLRKERRLVAETCRELAATLQRDVRALLWEGAGPRNPEAPPFPADVSGYGAQGVIDGRVWGALGGYDIYVGLIWLRMGTPTGQWRSGTEAEFRYAIEGFRERRRPSRVFFYRKLPRRPAVPAAGVADFVNELRSLGLPQDFRYRSQLRRMLVEHLSEAIRSL